MADILYGLELLYNGQAHPNTIRGAVLCPRDHQSERASRMGGDKRRKV